jgi:hypothetical protein
VASPFAGHQQYTVRHGPFHSHFLGPDRHPAELEGRLRSLPRVPRVPETRLAAALEALRSSATQILSFETRPADYIKCTRWLRRFHTLQSRTGHRSLAARAAAEATGDHPEQLLELLQLDPRDWWSLAPPPVTDLNQHFASATIGDRTWYLKIIGSRQPAGLASPHPGDRARANALLEAGEMLARLSDAERDVVAAMTQEFVSTFLSAGTEGARRQLLQLQFQAQGMQVHDPAPIAQLLLRAGQAGIRIDELSGPTRWSVENAQTGKKRTIRRWSTMASVGGMEVPLLPRLHPGLVVFGTSPQSTADLGPDQTAQHWYLPLVDPLVPQQEVPAQIGTHTMSVVARSTDRTNPGTPLKRPDGAPLARTEVLDEMDELLRLGDDRQLVHWFHRLLSP